MSLASYFTKKSGLKPARVNLAVVSDSGETKTVAINSVVSSTISRKESISTSCSDDNVKLKSEHKASTPLSQEKLKIDNFAFGFAVDGENGNNTEKQTISNSKKRRQRQKNKIKCSEKANGQDTAIQHQIIEPIECKEHEPLIVPSPKHTSSTNQDRKKDDPLNIPTKDESRVEIHNSLTEVQPPPGFKNQVTENKSLPTMTLLRPSDKFRKTPGKKKSKKNKKVSVARQMQLDELGQRKNEKNIQTKQQEMKLQFNAITKSKAMVNRGSLAVHREKTKQVGKQVEQPAPEVNPFSFGFNFNTLLPDTVLTHNK